MVMITVLNSTAISCGKCTTRGNEAGELVRKLKFVNDQDDLLEGQIYSITRMNIH